MTYLVFKFLVTDDTHGRKSMNSIDFVLCEGQASDAFGVEFVAGVNS